MTDSTSIAGSCDCLGRTCLKWGADGDLSALDLHLVLQRLALVDPELTALQDETPIALPSSSLSWSSIN